MRNWFRDSANRPLTNSLCARSNAANAADSSCVGWRGGGVVAGVGLGAGLGAGLTARAAATFCVFLTLETAVFFAVVFFAAAFGAVFLLLVTRLTGADFLTGRLLAVPFLVAGLAAVVARLAFGFEAVFALTARFAVFPAARFAEDRAVDRRKPFVRLLLILRLISKGCSVNLSSRGIGRSLA